MTVRSPTSPPNTTSTGSYRPPSVATITRERLPVRITASLGTDKAFSFEALPSEAWADCPGYKRPLALDNSTRTRRLREASLRTGTMAATLPVTGVSLPATMAVAFAPGRTCAASASGTATSSQTVERPLMRTKDCPAVKVMPLRTSRLWMTPPIGALTVKRALGCPADSTSRIMPSLMPTERRRSRAAASNAGSPADLSARNSC